jgi:hypothetical protein
LLGPRPGARFGAELHPRPAASLGLRPRQRRRSPARELRGCRVGTNRRQRLVQDLPHRAGRDPVAQAGEFALDSPVAPGRILLGQPQRQRPDGRIDRRSAWSAVRVGPVPREQVPMPPPTPAPTRRSRPTTGTGGAAATAPRTPRDRKRVAGVTKGSAGAGPVGLANWVRGRDVRVCAR